MIDKTKYTHHARFYGIPCYFNEATGELDGKNWFYAKILDLFVWVETYFPSNDYGFPIEIGEEIEK